MAKVLREGKHGIQMIRANELVPGDIVEVSGKFWNAYSNYAIKAQASSPSGR